MSVLASMGGAQAQLLPAAFLSVGVRVRGLSSARLNADLWDDRVLAKAWSLRRTMFLVPSDRLAVFVRGASHRAEKEIRWMLNRGVPSKVLEAAITATLAALDRPLRQSELAEAVAKSLGQPVRTFRGGGWGNTRKLSGVRVGALTCPAGYLLHLAGARGVICSGPNRGSEATYVRADAWLPRWKDLPQASAEEALLRLHLEAFGPGSVADFVAYTRMRYSDAKSIWSRVSAELVPVDVEGWPAWTLRKNLPAMERASPSSLSVRLLPYFDSFLLGHDERHHLVEERYLGRVYRPQGWIAPVLLIDGRVAGVWSHAVDGHRLTVRIEPFRPLPPEVQAQIREEADVVARHLGCAEATTRVG